VAVIRGAGMQGKRRKTVATSSIREVMATAAGRMALVLTSRQKLLEQSAK
jgi:hypothetical protein